LKDYKAIAPAAHFMGRTINKKMREWGTYKRVGLPIMWDRRKHAKYKLTFSRKYFFIILLNGDKFALKSKP
jgi:hypothetical protein